MEKELIAVDRIHLSKTEGIIKAYAAIRIADMFVIRNLKVVRGKNGLFVAMPAEKYTDKNNNEQKYADIAFPVNKETHQQVQALVLTAYEKEKQAQA